MNSKSLRLGPWLLVGAALLLLGCTTTSSSDGGGGGGSGTQSNPIVLTVGSSTTSSIDASGTVYYQFTTGSTGGDHTISLTGVDSDLSWDLYGEPSYSTWIAGCDDYFYTADESCSTGTLPGVATRWIKVIEWDGIAGNYTITVSTGGGGGGAISLTGQPYLSGSFVAAGGTAYPYIPVDSGVGYIYVELWDLAGNTVAFADSTTPGNATVLVSVTVPALTLSGTYYLGFIGVMGPTGTANTFYYQEGAYYHEAGYDETDTFFDNGLTAWTVPSLTVSGGAGTTVYIETTPDSSGLNADTVIDLYDSSGTTLLATNDDNYNLNCSLCSGIVGNLASGTYRLKISGFGGTDTGPYGVRVSTVGFWNANSTGSAGSTPADGYESDNTSGTATLLPLATIQDHNLYPSGDEDWVYFVVP